MNVYCVMSGEARTDLDHVIYASTSKADAENIASKNESYDYCGNPYITVLDVTEVDSQESENKE